MMETDEKDETGHTHTHPHTHSHTYSYIHTHTLAHTYTHKQTGIYKVPSPDLAWRGMQT